MSDTNDRRVGFKPDSDARLRADGILCLYPDCPRLRAVGVLCLHHHESMKRAIVRREADAGLTRQGVCKGCGNAIGAPNPARDPRYCLRCWEEAEALHDEELRRQARERVRGARGRRDRQAALPAEAILRDIEALGPMRWYETPRAVVWGYAVAALLVVAFAWRIVG